MKKKLRIYNILLVFFSLVFIVSAFLLTREIITRRIATEYVSSLQSEYVPTLPTLPVTDEKDPESSSADTSLSSGTAERIDTSNPTIEKLVSKYPDVVGWLTVEGANVSHPFVHTTDNSTYLWSDLDKNYINGGTLFMDYTNTTDMSDKITVIYGHNMRNGTMFGQLLNYLDFEYLLDNQDVYIAFPEKTAHYTAVACLIVDGADNPIYDDIGQRGDIQHIVDYIYANTEVDPDAELSGDSSLLILSTCHRAYYSARTLLICIPD